MQNPIGNEASIADREELRELVWPDEDLEKNRKAYDLRYLRMFGTDAGIMLSQLVYLTGKGDDPDGWIYKTREEIFEEFGLDGRRALYAARDRLQTAGILETEKRPRMGWREGEYRIVKPSPTTHYRIDLAILADLLERFEQDPEGTIETLNRDFKLHSHNSGDNCASERYEAYRLNGTVSTVQTAQGVPLERYEPYRLNEPDRTAPYTKSTSESTSEGTYKDNNKDSALQAGKKQFSDENSKEVPTSLVLAAKEKEEKQEPYNTLGSEPHPFGDDGAWDRESTEGDEEPASARSNGRKEDEEPAEIEAHNTSRSEDTILEDHASPDRESAENLTEEQRQENKQRLSSLMENEAMTHNTLGSSINFLDDPDAWDRGSAEIESEEEVFEMARSVFGHAHEGGMDEAS